MTPDFYPPPGFYFQLQFGSSSSLRDNAFQEVSGLTVELEVEEVREGGQNMYKHKLPTIAKYPNLVLKRGFVSIGSPLAAWCTETLLLADFTTPIDTIDVQLDLLNEQGTPLASWVFMEAWPVKWSMSDFKSMDNSLALESLEFAYAAFLRVT